MRQEIDIRSFHKKCAIERFDSARNYGFASRDFDESSFDDDKLYYGLSKESSQEVVRKNDLIGSSWCTVIQRELRRHTDLFRKVADCLEHPQ